MTKKADQEFSPFTTERTDWGVQLKLHPFEGIDGSKHSGMVMTADVARPKKERKAEVRIWFSGVSSGSLSHADTVAWMNSLRGLLTEAQRVGNTMRQSRN